MGLPAAGQLVRDQRDALHKAGDYIVMALFLGDSHQGIDFFAAHRELGKAQLGGFVSTSQKYPENQYIKYFASAVQGGVLDLPFQFVFKVVT